MSERREVQCAGVLEWMVASPAGVCVVMWWVRGEGRRRGVWWGFSGRVVEEGEVDIVALSYGSDGGVG